MATPTCPNCDAALVGRYCHECGQKRIEPAERRFSWFVGQLLREVALVDSRLARSLARLLVRPGTLDRDWLAGRRRRNTAPLNLFLGVALLYAWQQMRVGHATRWWTAAARVPLFFVGFVLTHLLFRFVQFLLVFATT